MRVNQMTVQAASSILLCALTVNNMVAMPSCLRLGICGSLQIAIRQGKRDRRVEMAAPASGQCGIVSI